MRQKYVLQVLGRCNEFAIRRDANHQMLFILSSLRVSNFPCKRVPNNIRTLQRKEINADLRDASGSSSRRIGFLVRGKGRRPDALVA